MIKEFVQKLCVQLVANTRGFSAGLKRTRAPIAGVRRAVRRLGRTIRRMVYMSLVPLRMLRRGFTRLWTSIRGTLRIMGGPLGRLGWFGGLGATGGGALAGAMALKTAGAFEQLGIAFETMIGSGTEAALLLKRLEKFSARTPFQLTDLAESAKQLMAFGISAGQILPTLKMLGDISSGLSIPMKELAWLYGQTKVEQRLYARDLRQFTTRGVPLITELAKQFGVAENKIRDLVAAGKVGFPHVQRALQSLTSAGGRFYQLTSKQSKSLLGLWSTLRDNVVMYLRDIGDSLAKRLGLKDLMRTIIARMSVNRGVAMPLIDKIIGHFIVIGKAVISLVMRMGPLLLKLLRDALLLVRGIAEALSKSALIQSMLGPNIFTEFTKDIGEAASAVDDFLRTTQQEVPSIISYLKRLWQIFTKPVSKDQMSKIWGDLGTQLEMEKLKIEKWLGTGAEGVSGKYYNPAMQYGSAAAQMAIWRTGGGLGKQSNRLFSRLQGMTQKLDEIRAAILRGQPTPALIGP